MDDHADGEPLTPSEREKTWRDASRNSCWLPLRMKKAQEMIERAYDPETAHRETEAAPGGGE